MGIISRTVLGRVVKRKSNCLTILLEQGNRVVVPVCKSSLRVGDKCNLCINNANGKITKILDYNDDTLLVDMVESRLGGELPTLEECNTIGEAEKGRVLGSQKSNEEEFEETEFLEWEFSRSPE